MKNRQGKGKDHFPGCSPAEAFPEMVFFIGIDLKKEFQGIWIDRKIWLMEGLTLMEKHFLSEINNLDNEHGCFASNNYFSDVFQVTPGRCSQVINSLKRKGHISVKMIKKGKLIEKRVLRILNTGIKNTKGGIYYSKEGIKNTKGGYLENAEGIHKEDRHKDNNDFVESPESKDLVKSESENRKVFHKILWAFFTKVSPEHFKTKEDRGREAPAIKRMITDAMARDPTFEGQKAFLGNFLRTSKYVCNGHIKSFLNGSPFIPSVIMSKGIKPRILELMIDKIKQREIIKEMGEPPV